MLFVTKYTAYETNRMSHCHVKVTEVDRQQKVTSHYSVMAYNTGFITQWASLQLSELSNKNLSSLFILTLQLCLADKQD